jgi:hypothetical protein
MDIFCLGARANPRASNNAQWLTEVGRLHPAEGVTKTFPYILRGLKKGKREQIPSKNFRSAALRIKHAGQILSPKTNPARSGSETAAEINTSAA